MIPGKNELKNLTKDISCECKLCNSDQWWTNDKCLCECKKRHVFGILQHVVAKMENI